MSASPRQADQVSARPALIQADAASDFITINHLNNRTAGTCWLVFA
jgi:hypothetical protein